MKNIKYVLFAFLAFTIILTGCFNPMWSGQNETAATGEFSSGPRVMISINLPADMLSGAKGFVIDTLTVTATRTDSTGTPQTITIPVTAGASSAAGVFDGLAVTEWLFEAEAVDSLGNTIYSGSTTYTVLDGEDNLITLNLFQNVGNLRITADWTGPGGVESLRVTASKTSFDDVVGEAAVLKESETGTVLALNLAEGSDWSLLVEGINGGETCFQATINDVAVTSGTTADVPATLAQVKVTPVAFSVPGGSYLAAFDLVLTTATSGATIYYTTDGTDPEAITEDQYSGAVTINGTTVKAFAVLGGLTDSAVTTVDYTVSGISNISVGARHTAWVKEDGTLWTWGYNYLGRLGTGDTTNVYQPVQIGGAEWLKVEAGWYNTAAIKSTDGSLWTWGRNDYGSLGIASYDDSYVPVQIDGTYTYPWVDVSAGNCYTLAINSNGELYAWGRNSNGQLGLGVGDTSDRNFPWQVGTATDWASVSAGNIHTLALKTDGSLWGWGYNGNGQLGNGTWTSSEVPILIDAGPWKEVIAGNNMSIGIANDDSVWVWGDSGYSNRLGTGDGADHNAPVQILASDTYTWSDISVGFDHGGAVNTLGEVWVWGENYYGELGLGDQTDRGTPQLHPSLALIDTLAFGEEFSLALGQDGKLWAWGHNEHGELPDENGPVQNRKTPYHIGRGSTWTDIAAGTEFGLAINESDGSIWSWGSYEYGKLGNGDSYGKSATLLQLPFPTGVTAWGKVSAGEHHAVALTDTGDLYSWGLNTNGQLGDGTITNKTAPVQPFDNQTGWADISAGPYFTVGLKSGEIYAWGSNYYGQLGDGSTSDRNRPTQESSLSTYWTDVVAGTYHVLAVKSDGSLWGWGRNIEYQLGLGNNDSPVTNPTRIGTDYDWVEVYAGYYHSVAKKSDGSLWGFGDGDYLGVGELSSTDDIVAPTRLRSGNDWLTAGAGRFHTFGLKTDNTLWGWGSGGSYRLGNGSTSHVYIPEQIGTDNDWDKVVGGYEHSLGLKADGTMWVWGSNAEHACAVWDYYGPFFLVPFLAIE